ncbi:MAG: DUF4397 domain-containing protein, partial [Usitatibacter sp.]
MKMHLWIAAVLAAMALVSGCKSNGHAQNSTDMRSLNAVVDAEPLDVLVDSDVKVSALPFASTSALSEFNSGTRDVQVRSSTSQTILSDKQISFSSGVNNTLVIFGKRAQVQTLVFTDDATAPSSGHFRICALNLSPDTGPVDIFATTGSSISSSGAVIPAATFGTLTGAAEVTTGQLVLTVTSSGTQDILFQSTAQGLTDNTTYTLVILPSLGGKLVSVVLMTQGSNATGTLLQNPLARVKAVNGIPDSTPLNFKADGTVLLSSVPFTGASSYVTTAAGTRNLQIEASSNPGTIIASKSTALASSRDYSMVAVGTLSAPQLAVFTDDNSLPASGFAKIRFANALVGSTGVDVLLNFASQTTNLGFAQASTYFQVTPSLTYTITFATPGGVTVLASLSPVERDAGASSSAYL